MLHRLSEIKGLGIQALDGELGSAAEFFFDDVDWTIRYILIDTASWLPRRKVLVSPQWIEAIDWPQGPVRVRVEREQVRTSPDFDLHLPLERDYESRLHEHYGRSEYWVADEHARPVRIG